MKQPNKEENERLHLQTPPRCLGQQDETGKCTICIYIKCNRCHLSKRSGHYACFIEKVCRACELQENQPPPPKVPASALIKCYMCNRYQVKDQYPKKGGYGGYKECIECAGPYTYPSRPRPPLFLGDKPYSYTPSYQITTSPSQSAVNYAGRALSVDFDINEWAQKGYGPVTIPAGEVVVWIALVSALKARPARSCKIKDDTEQEMKLNIGEWEKTGYEAIGVDIEAWVATKSLSPAEHVVGKTILITLGRPGEKIEKDGKGVVGDSKGSNAGEGFDALCHVNTALSVVYWLYRIMDYLL